MENKGKKKDIIADEVRRRRFSSCAVRRQEGLEFRPEIKATHHHGQTGEDQNRGCQQP